MRFGKIVCIICFAIAWAASNQVAAKPPAIDVIAQSPFFSHAQMSPDGQFLVARVSEEAESYFTVFRWNGGDVEPIFQAMDTDDVFVQWAQWLNEHTLMLRIGRYSGQKIALRIGGKREKYRPYFSTSLYVLSVTDDANEKQKPIRKISDDGYLVSVLPNDPDHVLIERQRGESVQVEKVNIYDDKDSTVVQSRVFDIQSWTADRNGDVRIGFGYTDNNDKKLIVKLGGTDEFLDLSEFVADVDQRFEPLAFAEDINEVYVLSNHETDTLALYVFNLETGDFTRQVYHNPDYDISEISVDDKTGALISVTFEGEAARTIWFDKTIRAEIEKLAKLFPKRQVVVDSFSDDAAFGVVTVSAPDFPGQLFVYNKSAGSLTGLPPQYPKLPADALGVQIPTSYTARDGTTIPAYVTLPSSLTKLSQAQGLPFIIMPHGGPAARDFADFDMWAQSYAMLGYGVLQTNFRGSRGFGLSYEIAGRQQWGRLMQDDITDGVQWLINEGLADPERIAIVGASYGGYAALMGAVKTPELYQCAVSFAGVTNLFELVKNARRDSYVERLVGDRYRQNEYLRSHSPLFLAGHFGIPVLLIHGRLDPIVSFEQSEALETKLSRLRQPVEFIPLPRTAHGLNDYDDRIRFYAEQRRYIKQCLGAP